MRETRVYHVDKEKEKDKLSDDALIADFKYVLEWRAHFTCPRALRSRANLLNASLPAPTRRSHVVIFRDPPLDVITLVTPAEAVSTFVLYVSRPSAAAATASSNGAAGNARAIAESPAAAAAVAGAAASSVRVHVNERRVGKDSARRSMRLGGRFGRWFGPSVG